ncbi:hypothetical protein CA236_00210 [Sphingomonas sp. ABOLG]|uniref:hypothetical protein n=1 Tax=Sphingomonas sp. ABOLG TaxID=1985880 RepID=UPI000F7E398C|nr:hypothetical protein [Sphingomonas sp. ABOLG]RSV20376.1 hypothetical protein CA236_00210 [Sphingomonas sp. ABOLG]
MISELLFDDPGAGTEWAGLEFAWPDDSLTNHVWDPCFHSNADIMRGMAELAISQAAPTYVVYSLGTQTSAAASHQLYRFLAVGALCTERVYSVWTSLETAGKPTNPKSDWIALSESSTDTLTFSQVGAIVDSLSSRLSQADFSSIDDDLASATIEMMSPEAIVTIARTTFSARTELSHWRSFVERAKAVLTARGAGTRMLAGLD